MRRNRRPRSREPIRLALNYERLTKQVKMIRDTAAKPSLRSFTYYIYIYIIYIIYILYIYNVYVCVCMCVCVTPCLCLSVCLSLSPSLRHSPLRRAPMMDTCDSVRCNKRRNRSERQRNSGGRVPLRAMAGSRKATPLSQLRRRSIELNEAEWN